MHRCWPWRHTTIMCRRSAGCCARYVPTIWNVFTQQPAYFDDLDQACRAIKTSLDTVQDRVDTLTQLGDGNRDELVDVVSYITDLTVSLEALAASHPPCARTYRECEMEQRLSAFYQGAVVTLCR